MLRDLCEPLCEDEFIVVGSASQCPEAGQLETLLDNANEQDGVTLLVGEDGVPTGLMLIRCRALALVPPVGFHDLKEQALPQIERASGVHVLRARTGACRPIRSVRSYLDVVRSWQESGSLRGVRLVRPLEERWRPAFAIVEDGAEVARDARLHDSVVLRGGGGRGGMHRGKDRRRAWWPGPERVPRRGPARGASGGPRAGGGQSRRGESSVIDPRGPNSTTRWRRWDVLGISALVLLGAMATYPAWQDIFLIATRDEEQSHVLLVPVVAAWLVWVRRARLRRCPRDFRYVGPALIALGWAATSIGDLRLIQALWHAGAVLVFVGCVVSFTGARLVARLLPAFVVLVFLVPVPGMLRQQVALPLQTATADVTQRILDTFGVEAARAGNALAVNGHEIRIADACNGLRMVSALFLVSFAFAYGLPLREPVRWLILFLSPLSAILCNVARLIPTILAYAYVSDAAGERVHDIGGWVMLPVAFLLLLGIVRSLRWALLPVYRYTLAYGR